MASIITKIRTYFSPPQAVSATDNSPDPSRNALENPSTPINGDTLSDLSKSGSGVNVTEENILSITALWRAVTILAGVIASLPISVYRITDTSAEKQPRHPITRLLARNPSRLYTKFDFMQTLILHLSLVGNFYALIIRNGGGTPTSLAILNPNSIKIETNARNEIIYVYQETRQDGMQTRTMEKRYNSDRIIHVSGLSWLGLLGEDVMKLFNEVFGTAISSQDYLANFFANGAHLSGAVTVPQKLDAIAYNRMKASWNSAYAGAKKAGGTAILEQGATYTKIGLSPSEAGSEIVKKITTASIANITGVPAFLLEDLDRATYHNIEQLNTAFGTYTVRPLCYNIQEEFSRKLLPDSQVDTHEVRIDVDSLLSADAASRAKRIDTLMKWGVINRDEARAMENMNPIADGSGQKYFVPLNMVNPENEPEDGTDNEEI